MDKIIYIHEEHPGPPLNQLATGKVAAFGAVEAWNMSMKSRKKKKKERKCGRFFFFFHYKIYIENLQ
jgi:hypothetical protein